MCEHDIKFAEIDAKIERMQIIINNLIFDPVDDKLLISNEIMEKLNISRQAFNTKINELKTAGMFKIGQWRMRQSALNNYIKKLENVS